MTNRTHNRMTIIRMTGIWILFYLLFFFVLSIFNGAERAAFLSLLIILPVIPPVHLNNYLIVRYFSRQMYAQYFALLIAVLVIFGFVAQLLMNIFHNVEGEYIGAMLNPFVVVLITTGIKSFRENLLNKYKIAEARVKQAEAELRLSEVESQQIRAELNLLKAQINPHFLFNALNSIYSLSLNQSEKTPSAVMLLSKLMRYHLESSNTPEVPLSEEVDFIHSYIELEKLRFGKKCIIDFDYTGVNESIRIPPLLLIPLVENCFKHGMSMEKERNEISINLHLKNKHLEFETMNSIPEKGSNYSDDKKVKTGIPNVKRRLKILYDNRFQFNIEESKGKYHTSLIIDL